ncbi:MAG: type III restriction enzyme, partial [Akkermansiaceae bacterium]
LEKSHSDKDDLSNVLRYHERTIAKNLHQQMQAHFWEKSAGFEVKILKGWMALKECPFNAEEGNDALNFRTTPVKKSEIRKNIYTGFSKCLYPHQKFDSDAERRFAEVLENDSTVEKWFKPASGQFQLYYRIGTQGEKGYEPDFVIETKTHRYLAEVKAANELKAVDVVAKAEAGKLFCDQATEHTTGKPWQYLLISDQKIAPNMTVKAFA